MKESKNEVLSEYKNRLKKEALLKAALSSLAVSFAAVLVVALILWFTAFSGYWILALAFILPAAIAFPLFYFFAFFPTERYVAKRLDKLGLEERILTMTEFGAQDSYIMQRQRQDALAALSKLDSKLIKLAVSAGIITLAVLGIVTGTAMTSVYALAEAGVIPTGKELIENMNKDDTVFDVVYKVPDSQQGWGVLYSASVPEGASVIELKVNRGADGENILPVANKGYVFRGWSDGVGSVIRSDSSVQGKIIVTAIFEEIGIEFEDDEAKDELNFSGGGSSSDSTTPNPPDENNPSPPSDPNNRPDNSTYVPNQYVIDGATDYGEVYGDYADGAFSELSQTGGADGSAKGIAGSYWDVIARG